MELNVAVELDGQDRPVLVVGGAIDLASRERFLDRGYEMIKTSTSDEVLIDLADVNFLDSLGIGALVQLNRASNEASKRMVLRNPSERVRSLLRRIGLESAWPIE